MTTTLRYFYTGQPIQVVIPPGVTLIGVDMQGAAGAGFVDINRRNGGLGSRLQVNVPVTPGEVLWVYIGGRGDGQSAFLEPLYGWNGGGSSGFGDEHGGGATDIRRGGQGLENRILIAGGGGAASAAGRGGGAAGSPQGAGGEGGLQGIASFNSAGEFVGTSYTLPGLGGTQSEGGRYSGTLGQGGASGGTNPGGGGGGGFYGGGAGGGGAPGQDGAGGGGGSSYSAFGGAVFSPGAGADGAMVIIYDRPPDPPTRLTPTNVGFAQQARNRLAWRHNDPDGDPQTAYRVQRRPKGSSVAWTEYAEDTPNQFFDLPAGEPLGAYEWRVRTRSMHPDVSQYSDVGFYTISTAPPGPTWVDPINGQAIPTRTYTVRWSGTGSFYRMRSVADDGAGNPNPDVILTAATALTAVGARTRVWTFPVNSRVEHLQVQEEDTFGLASPWTDARLQVSYTLPVTADVVLRADPARASLLVSVATPSVTGRPAAVSHDVHFRAKGSTDEPGPVLRGVGVNRTAEWRHPVSGVDYDVRVSTLGDNGAVDPGVWLDTPTGQPDLPAPEGAGRYDTARYDTATYG